MTGIGEVFLLALGTRSDALHPALAAQLRDPRRRLVLRGRFTAAGSRLGAVNALARPFVGPAALLTAYERDVPFQVELRSTRDAEGSPVLRTTRRFRFRVGEQTIADALSVATVTGAVRSALGSRGRAEVTMLCDVDSEGSLRLVSQGIALRLCGVRLPLPRGLGPRIRVTDGWDEVHQRRTIEMIARHPLIGTVLEYRGWFAPSSG